MKHVKRLVAGLLVACALGAPLTVNAGSCDPKKICVVVDVVDDQGRIVSSIKVCEWVYPCG